MPFLLRFCAAIRDWGARNNCQSQKSCNSDRFFVAGLLGGAPRQRWDVADPMRNGVDLARGGVDSMQRQGIAQPRRLGAVRVPCQGVARVRHRDVAPLPR